MEFKAEVFLNKWSNYEGIYSSSHEFKTRHIMTYDNFDNPAI